MGALQILRGYWYSAKCYSGSGFCYSFVGQPKDVMRVYLSLLSVAAGTDMAGDKIVFFLAAE